MLKKVIQNLMRPSCHRWVVASLLLWALPTAVQAQFTFQTDLGRTMATITAYSGPGGDVIIPSSTTKGVPVKAIRV